MKTLLHNSLYLLPICDAAMIFFFGLCLLDSGLEATACSDLEWTLAFEGFAVVLAFLFASLNIRGGGQGAPWAIGIVLFLFGVPTLLHWLFNGTGKLPLPMPMYVIGARTILHICQTTHPRADSPFKAFALGIRFVLFILAYVFSLLIYSVIRGVISAEVPLHLAGLIYFLACVVADIVISHELGRLSTCPQQIGQLP